MGVLGLIQSVLRALSLLWFHLTHLIFGHWLESRSTASHTLLLIGDEVAEGLGAGVMIGQAPVLVRTLAQLIEKDIRVVRRWRCAERGYFGSRSSDWLATCAARPPWTRVPRRVGRDNLFKTVFSEGAPHAAADVVVVMVGRNDFGHASPDETVENLTTLALELVDRGKRVFVSELLLPLEMGEEYMWVRSVNELLARALEGYAEKHGVEVHLWQGCARAELQREEYNARDERNLNSAGYRKAAASLKEWITTALIRVEAVWKRSLF